MLKLVVAWTMLLCGAALAQSGPTNPSGPPTSYSGTIGTTPVQVWGAYQGRQWSRIINANTTSGAVLWCSRTLTATSTPVLAANAAGAFPVGPPGNAASLPYVEEFINPGYVPSSALWCVAASGTVAVTAEAAPQ